MASTTPFSAPFPAFVAGVRDSTPFLFMAGPFGLLFGVLAAEAGLNITEVMAFTVAVFAGAAQFTALQLMQENTPTVVVLISALAVNLRVAMYSAALTPYIGAAPMWQRAIGAYFIVDQSYALSVLRFERSPDMPLPQKVAYFFGTCALIAPFWYAMSWLGAVAGAQLPLDTGLDFALPIAFLAMLGPMFRTPAHRIAALVSAATALLAAGLPHNLGLIVAGLLGMMAGARAELWLARNAGSQE